MESALLAFIQREMAGKSFIFYTLSSAHLYGFPSHDSDFDIHGCHIMDAREVCGLCVPKDFIEKMEKDIDFVSFDIRKEPGHCRVRTPGHGKTNRVSTYHTGEELPPQMVALLPSAEQLRDVIIDSEANDRVSPQDQD